ncbi:MAG: urease accessory protein UreF [Alphaproteobacteria bacterium]|nr:urease accessory protein UreF [Alphaproteobacteria bacterium]
MADAAALLLALQFADSAFPAGGFAFSWGLEGLVADGLVTDADDVADVVAQQLTLRWQSMDRVLLVRAHAANDAATQVAVDRLAEAVTFSAPMRAGSRRAGRALLGVCARLGLPAATAYQALAADDARLGHLAVVQGIVYRAAGMTCPMAELVSGWSLISGFSSAAVRLGVIGHVEALRITTALRAALADLLAAPARPAELPASFTPLADIAVMRNHRRDLRMFAT